MTWAFVRDRTIVPVHTLVSAAPAENTTLFPFIVDTQHRLKMSDN